MGSTPAIIFKVVAVFFARYTIQSFSKGFFNIFRVGVGAIIFFFIVIALFGVGHFADLFSSFLWKWMLLYGGVAIALRNYFIYIGLQHAKAAEIAISSAIAPVSSLFFAYLFLGKVPDLGQWLGSSVIFLGILIALVSKLLEKEKVVLQQPIGFSGN